MTITIRHVAARAGVSISTVSRVLNDTCAVNEDKRRRVKEAIATLGYTPNPAARSLLKRETRGLGVLLPFVGGEFFSELLTGMDRAAQKKGYFLMISTSHRHEGEVKAALEGMHRRVDGLLIMAPEMIARDIRALVRFEAPTVFVNTRVEEETSQVINFDNYGGIYEMTRHMLDLGHRRIAFILGPELAHDARERRRGFRDAMCTRPDTIAFEFSATLEDNPDDYSQESGYMAAQRALKLNPRPTAIVAANDQSAIGALRACVEAGVNVPRDLSVSGFDDVPSARFSTPRLSTVRVPVREVGKSAIETLLTEIHSLGKLPPVRKTIPVECIYRESTAPPPVDRMSVSPN